MGACASKTSSERNVKRGDQPGGPSSKSSGIASEAGDALPEVPGKVTDVVAKAGNDSNGSFSGSWASSAPADQDQEGEDRPVLNRMSTSKLEEHSRRRLTVSTINADGTDNANLIGSTPQSLINLQDIAAAVAATAAAGGGPSGVGVTSGQRRRSQLKKYNDPAMQLVDEPRGAIRIVSVQMLLGLCPDATSTLAIFGAPSWDIQKGFDNKALQVMGTDADLPPASLGIGFACKKGLKPESPNQDDFFILRVDDWAMYGVFDGHGPSGHEVSNFVHTALPFLIMADPQFEEDTPATLRRAFRKVHHLLEAAAEQPGSHLDCTLSGTTGTVVVHRDDKLYVAHVGDSRAVLGTFGTGKNKSHSITMDHKPTIPAEKSRIEANGGEVRRLEGDIPYRVFVKNRMYPGLAMSRAIGDSVGAAIGVVSDPDVKIVELKSSDDMFVVSTDGVWEFISSQEAVDFCAVKGRQVQQAADLLAYESWRRWVEEEENVVDDVTCIVVALKEDEASSSDSSA